MPRLGNDSKPLTQAFIVYLTSPATFHVEEVRSALRNGIQDILQDADIHTGVDYQVESVGMPIELGLKA